MTASALIIGAEQKIILHALRDFATLNPIDVLKVRELIKSQDGHAAHLERMKLYSTKIPSMFYVTFSVETGHPVGTCRHISVSSRRRGRVPTPEAVWMLAREMGFVGGLGCCTIWDENIGSGDLAINLVQPLDFDPRTFSTLH
jgi:hypothetical protein